MKSFTSVPALLRPVAGFCIALSFLSRLRSPWVLPVEHPAWRSSFFFYPAAGALLGLIAAIPTVIFAEFYPWLQTFILFTSVLYLVILEWLARFLHFDGFCDVCDALGMADADPAKRLAVMKDPHIGSAALACGAFLLIGKALGMYLLFTRSALICVDLSYLLFMLILIPAAGRLSILILAYLGTYPRAKGTGSFIVGKLSAGTVISAAGLLSLFVLIGFALHFRFGTLFQLRSWSGTLSIWRRIAEQSGADGWASLIPVLLHSSGAFALLAMACYFSVFYWYRQSHEKIGGVTGDLLGAVCETTEFAVIAALLILTVG